MSDYNYRTAPAATADAGVIDQGLRAYMLRVYNYMLFGLALTGVAAYATFVYEPLARLFFDIQGGYLVGITGLGWVAVFAPLVLVLILSFGINRLSAATAQIMFWVYATIVGFSLAILLFTYTGESVARVFFITAATFGAMSLYGYTTKRDLTSWGSFLFMGLIGIIIASVVNMFVQSSMMGWIISVIGVIVFTGLTAYDTQKIKESYSASMDGELMKKGAIMGALNLYLDFINLFIMLMRLLGDRR